MSRHGRRSAGRAEGRVTRERKERGACLDPSARHVREVNKRPSAPLAWLLPRSVMSSPNVSVHYVPVIVYMRSEMSRACRPHEHSESSRFLIEEISASGLADLTGGIGSSRDYDGLINIQSS
jgi:hypothetical protein